MASETSSQLDVLCVDSRARTGGTLRAVFAADVTGLSHTILITDPGNPSVETLAPLHCFTPSKVVTVVM